MGIVLVFCSRKCAESKRHFSSWLQFSAWKIKRILFFIFKIDILVFFLIVNMCALLVSREEIIIINHPWLGEIIMSFHSWVLDQFLLHIWVGSQRCIHSCVAYHMQVHWMGPICLQLKPKQISSNLKASIGHECMGTDPIRGTLQHGCCLQSEESCYVITALDAYIIMEPNLSVYARWPLILQEGLPIFWQVNFLTTLLVQKAWWGHQFSCSYNWVTRYQ